MAETAHSPRQHPQPAAFDVRGWLATVGHFPKEAIQYVAESERSGQRIVTYNCAGSIAKVRMSVRFDPAR